MALSPDDIERRTFAVAPQGYDVDEVRTFLFDVAAGLREATRPAPVRSSTTPRADATRWPERPETFRIAADEVLSSAHAAGIALPGDVGTSVGALDAALDSPLAEPHHTPLDTPRDSPLDSPLDPPLDSPLGSSLDAVLDTPRAGRFDGVGAAADAAPAPLGAPPPPDPDTTEAGAGTGAPGDAYAQLGVEVAELLRAAHESAASVRAHAETDARERLHEAAREASIVLRKAERDAGLVHDEAKRVLTTAQEQADTIVSDAEYTAREILASAAVHAEEHTRATTDRARRHADEVLRAERDALTRLRAAQAGVSAAIDRIARSDNRPVVDIRREVGDLRFGISDGSADGTAGPPGSGDGIASDDGTTAAGDLVRAGDDDASPSDPALALIRKAVGRAIVAAVEAREALDADAADAPDAPAAPSGPATPQAPDAPVAAASGDARP